MTTKLTTKLRLENDQEGNTWYSTGDHDENSDIHVHMSRWMYLALGSPPHISVIIEGTR